MLWPEVGQRYQQLFNRVTGTRAASPGRTIMESLNA
jgi:hypothetical protein